MALSVRSASRLPKRSLSRGWASTSSTNYVNIMEVGPRDGLQNEKRAIPPATKIELINRLANAGLTRIEAGSFVSPKWVPQMAGTPEVISQVERLPGVRYPVLVPNIKGLENLLTFLSGHSSSSPPPTDEVAVFIAATDAFSKANTNCTVAESLERTSQVVRLALEKGLRVRGYLSVVIACPYSGPVDYGKVRDLTKQLLDMGCYEVSLGDTTGVGNPHSISEMLNTVMSINPVEKLAGHFHDTYGMGVANVMAALAAGIRTIDSSVGGLGGCPYSPGATGNVATEDVLYALKGSPYTASGDLNEIANIGMWISHEVGRESSSRVGKALQAKKLRQRGRETQEAKL